MEGWNLGFACLVGHTHPSLWNLIKKLRADAHLSLTHVQQHNRGDPFKKKQKREYVHFEIRMQNLCLRLEAGGFTMRDFIDQAAVNLRQ